MRSMSDPFQSATRHIPGGNELTSGAQSGISDNLASWTFEGTPTEFLGPRGVLATATLLDFLGVLGLLTTLDLVGDLTREAALPLGLRGVVGADTVVERLLVGDADDANDDEFKSN